MGVYSKVQTLEGSQWKKYTLPLFSDSWGWEKTLKYSNGIKMITDDC